MTTEELENDHGFSIPEPAPASGEVTIIKVVGVGGGGGNAITYMYKKGIDKISYALCNTDRQAMAASPVETKVLLGPTVTKGLGAGNEPKVAAEAAEESIPELTRLFSDGTQMVFITAGMGGGTGTGAAPVVAKVAREMGLLTIGIVTLPFLMEGETKIRKAIEGANEMRKYVDALLIINNQILIEQFGELDFITAFSKADDTLSNAANSIAEIIYTDGYINLDFRDVEKTLRNGGAAVISTGYGEGENRVTNAVRDALNSPLLRINDIHTSKRILFNLYSSRNATKPLQIGEINEFQELTKKISGLDLIFGVAFDDSLGDKVKVSILASGFNHYILSDKGENKNVNEEVLQFDSSADENRQKDTSDDVLAQFYGKDNIDKFKEHKDSVNFVILSKKMMENDDVLELLESTPAYDRTSVQAENIRTGRAANVTRNNDEDITFDFSSSQSKLNDNNEITW